ncbi:MAG: OmpH family outer membrane protein [Nitrospira sp.]|nr:OmpH family outer membrane protein [Nitrospira sp.]MDH4327557.1 OmpH family outer membrane protein [Nitrospira sp.]MDH5624620.1 OmpH family outer membrane protein [Nitrospira sp.]
MMRGTDIIRVMGVAVLAICVQTAQAGDAGKIGVMDQQAVMERSKAGKAALEEIKQYSTARQKIIDADEQELKDLEQSLQGSGNKLSEAAKQEKQEQFRVKVDAYQRRLQDFNREVQQKQRDMIEEYSKRIAEVAQIVAQKEGYLAILDKGNEALLRIVLYHHPGLDVTDLVVKEFDRHNK